MRTGSAAAQWGKNQVAHPSRNWHRWCLVFVRSCFGISSKYGSAGIAWDRATKKHRTNRALDIPAFVPVFWETPGVADHVAFSVGNGMCLSTDIAREGKVDLVHIDTITRKWKCTLKGWTEDLNGVIVYKKPKPAELPTVSLEAMVRAAHADPKAKQGHGIHPVWTNRVEAALRAEGLLKRYAGDGSFGSYTVSAYAAWQRKLGYKGKAADGIPGSKSLSALCKKHGLRMIG